MNDASSPAGDLPLVVLGGYLGAGKTTLLNRLLRHAGGRRIAVLVNDFGAIDIDAELIEGQDGDTISLAGGCVCCSFGADLVGALAGLAQRSPRPDIAVIELSGVALPGAVMRSARLAAGIAVQGCVVLADATDIHRLVADPYVGDTVRQQLADADLVLLTKADLLAEGEAALDALGSTLEALAGRARVIARGAAEVPMEVLLDWSGTPGSASVDEPSPSMWSGGPASLHSAGRTIVDASLRFASASAMLPDPIDARALAQALADPANGLLRAKGRLLDADGRGQLLQVVGPRWQLTEMPIVRPGRLVTIGPAGRWDASRLAAVLRGAEKKVSTPP